MYGDFGAPMNNKNNRGSVVNTLVDTNAESIDRGNELVAGDRNERPG